MRISTFIEKFKSALQSKVCLLCEEKLGTYSQFCDHCYETLGIRQPEPVLQTSAFQCHAATTFNPAVKKLVYGHKFYNRMAYVTELAGLLIQYWEQCSPGLGFHATHPENVLVLPIPPHGQESSLIDMFASCFARHFGYDYRYDVLTWMRDVRPQHRIQDKAQRLRNVAQSLHLRSGIVCGYEKIIVIDDITTTGATLMEASRAILNDSDSMALFCLAVSKVQIGEQLRTGQEMAS